MRKIAVYNKKGGVGKSTISVQLAHGLAREGNKILLFDLDGQNNCSLFLGFSDYDKTFVDVIDKRYPEKIENCVYEVRNNLYILPNSDYEVIENRASDYPRPEYFIKDFLTVDNYDYVIIDCPPTALGINKAILLYADEILVPVLLESGSIQGVKELLGYLELLKLPNSMIKWIVPNKFRKTTNLHNHYLGKLADIFPKRILKPIPERIKIADLATEGKTVFENKSLTKHFKPIIRRVKNE